MFTRTTRHTRNFRTPGAYAASLGATHRRAVRRTRVKGIGAALVAFSVSYLVAAPTTRQIAALVGVVLVMWTSYAGRADRVAGAKAAAGARSERRVASALMTAKPAAVINSALLGPGADIDHLVAGPGLAVIETKTGKGQVRVDDDRVTVNGRVLLGDPLRVVVQSSDRAMMRFRVGCERIICVTDMAQRPFTIITSDHRPVTICSVRDLPRVVAGLPDRGISVSTAHKLGASIAEESAAADRQRQGERAKEKPTKERSMT